MQPVSERQGINQPVPEEQEIKQPVQQQLPLNNLTALPASVLRRIVEFIYLQSFLESDVTSKRKAVPMKRHVVSARDYHSQPVHYEVYWDHEGPPILTTLQSLGTVNKQFHELCVPWLWRVSFSR